MNVSRPARQSQQHGIRKSAALSPGYFNPQHKVAISRSPSTLWQVALDRARSAVGNATYTRIVNGSFDELKGSMLNLRKKHKRRDVSSAMLKLESFFSHVKSFEQTVSAFCSGHDEAGHLVWGSLEAFLMHAAKYAYTFNSAVDMFSSSVIVWPRFEYDGQVFPNNTRVEDAIAEFYDEFIQFCLKAAQHRLIYPMLWLTWPQECTRFDALKAHMQQCQTVLQTEAEATTLPASLPDHQEREDLTKKSASHSFGNFNVSSNAIVHAGDQHLHFYQDRNIQEAADLIQINVPQPRLRLPYRHIPITKNSHYFHRPRLFKMVDSKIRVGQEGTTSSLVSALLHGLGGVGKTQAVAHYAYQHWQDFEAIIWIGADGLAKLASDYFEAAKAMNLCRDNNRTDGIAALKTWLENTESTWLVIFDNVVDPKHLLDFWPSRGNQGIILATSRGTLRGVDIIDHEIPVEPLSKQESVDMLFYVLATKTSADALVISAIADHLYGLPLAISQMAGYINQTHVNLDNFLQMYEQQGQQNELRGIETNIDHVQYRYTLATVFSVSFSKLNEGSRMLLDMCAMLDPDGIPEELFLSSRGQKENSPWMRDSVAFNLVVSDLLGHTLLNRKSLDRSFSVHREVQRSALQDLHDKGVQNFKYVLEVVMALLYDRFPRQSPIGEPITDWDRCENFAKHVLRIACVFEDYLDEVADEETMKLASELYCDCGVYLWSRGLLTESILLARKSIKFADATLQKDDCLRAQPRTLLGCALVGRENSNTEAMQHLEEALHIRQENAVSVRQTQLSEDLDIQLANSYNNLGFVKRQMGAYDDSVQLNQKSIAIKRKYPADTMAFLLALSYHNLGQTYMAQGKPNEARDLLTRCVDLMSYTDQEMLLRKSEFLYTLGKFEHSEGDSMQAMVRLVEAFRIQQQYEPGGLKTAFTSHHLGVISFEKQDFESARLFFSSALNVFSSPKYFSKAKKGRSAFWLGHSLLAVGKVAASTPLLADAAKLFADVKGERIADDFSQAAQQYDSIIAEGT